MDFKLFSLEIRFEILNLTLDEVTAVTCAFKSLDFFSAANTVRLTAFGLNSFFAEFLSMIHTII